MIGYTLKHVLELIPEAFPLTKRAHVEQNFPTEGRDNCLASALSIEYLKHIKKAAVDFDTLDGVYRSITAYGLHEKVAEFSNLMQARHRDMLVKQSKALTPSSFLEKQAFWEGELSNSPDLVTQGQQAVELVKQASIVGVEPSPRVLRYSGNLPLEKEAALSALNSRFHLTKNPVLLKIAAALGKENSFIFNPTLVQSLCSTISGLDKAAGLSARGFDFYKEALVEKQAALRNIRVRVGKEEYPIESIQQIPSHLLSQYLGEDFGKELSGQDPITTKAVVESLPMDLQNVLLSLLKNTSR